MTCGPAWISLVRYRRAVRMNRRAGHPARSSVQQLTAGAGHEPGRDRGAAGADGRAGEAAPDPGQCPGPGPEVAADSADGAGEPDEPVPPDRSLPGDGLPGLLDLLAGAAQCPSGAVAAVLAADDLVTALSFGPGRSERAESQSKTAGHCINNLPMSGALDPR